jgi:hypothetical protein
VVTASLVKGFIPIIDGGSTMPSLYEGWFNEQIAKQASTAVGRAVNAGKVRISYHGIKWCKGTFCMVFQHFSDSFSHRKRSRFNFPQSPTLMKFVSAHP